MAGSQNLAPTAITKKEYEILAIFFFAILALNLLSAWNNSMTTDEMNHYLYGYSISELNSDRSGSKSDSKMPFSYLNVLPYRALQLVSPELVEDKRDFLLGRYILIGRTMTVLFSILLAFYIFKWARELYGVMPGFFALLLFTLEPNIIAHSQLITTDIYAAGMITISTYYFWRLTKSGGWKNATFCAIALGLSQLAKYTCVFLYIIFLLIVIARFLPDLVRLMKRRDLKGIAARFTSFLKYSLLFAIVSVIIINAGFLFNGTFTPLNEYSFRSDLFKNIQVEFPALSSVPMPLPYPYVDGMDWVKFNESTGTGFGNIYLMGRLQERGKNYEGFDGYYFYAFLYKVPIALQMLILFAVLYYVYSLKRYKFLEDELFLSAPVIFFSIQLNYFDKAQIGLRHFLVVFPLLFIFCGLIVREWGKFKLRHKGALILVMLYFAASVFSYFPHFLPYFNELVWDRKKAYKILADSNVDWGQCRLYLEKYIKLHPDTIVNPQAPVAGRIAVSVNNLTGVSSDPEMYRWLRDNFQPVDDIAHGFLVYDISPRDIENLKLKDGL